MFVYQTGPKLNRLREGQPEFIAERLELGQDREVSNHDLARAYADWLGVENWSTHDMHNLYLLLIDEHDVREHEPSNRFLGVGLR